MNNSFSFLPELLADVQTTLPVLKTSSGTAPYHFSDDHQITPVRVS